MKLNIFKKEKEPELSPMLCHKEINDTHNLLVAIVTGQTPIKFGKLRKGEINPIQMVAEVLAFVLKHPNGRQVEAMIEHLRKQLNDFYAKQAEQEKIVGMIEKNYEQAPQIFTPNNGSTGKG